MKNKIKPSLALLFATTLFTSCITSTGPQLKLTVPTDRTPNSSASTLDHDELEETFNELNQLSDLDQFKYRIKQWVRFYIIFGAQTQKIVSSFDEKISLGAANPNSSNIEVIKSEIREIDCQMGEIVFLTHTMEERLKGMYKAVLYKQSEELADWFLESLAVAKGFDTIPQILARYTHVKMLKSYHDSICKTMTCPRIDFSSKRMRFPFNIYNNLETLNYKKSNIKDIALFAANSLAKNDACATRSPSGADDVAKNYFGGTFPIGTYSVTYDDGPHPTFTSSILNSWLKSGLAKPTFFWLAKDIIKFPETVTEVVDAEVEVASHSYSHADIGNIVNSSSYEKLNRTNVELFFPKGKTPVLEFSKWQEQTLKQEFYTALEVTENALQKVPNSHQKTVSKFRLPYGSGYNNERLLKMMKARNLSHFHWLIDSLDWQDKNPLSVLERIKKQMQFQKRGIILFHDIHQQSAEATQLLIDYIKSTPNIKIEELNKLI